MTPEQRVILDLSEVKAIRLECSKCGAAVVFKPQDWRGAPLECPGCTAMWELPYVEGMGPSPLQQFGVGMRGLLDLAKAAATSGSTVPYRVRLETRDPMSSIYGGSDS